MNFCVYPQFYSEVHLERIVKNTRDIKKRNKFYIMWVATKHENLLLGSSNCDRYEQLRGLNPIC